MATRFETKDGQNLGMKFAGRRGRTLHISHQELKILFSLDEDTKIDGDSVGDWTAGELLDLWASSCINSHCTKGNCTSKKECHKADLEDMKRFGRTSMDDTLGHQKETRLFLGENGEIEERTFFTR